MTWRTATSVSEAARDSGSSMRTRSRVSDDTPIVRPQTQTGTFAFLAADQVLLAVRNRRADQPVGPHRYVGRRYRKPRGV